MSQADFFYATKSSVSSVSFVSQHTVRCKAKSLLLSTANFQILWNKKEEFETFVLDNYIYIVTGSENYLIKGTSNEEFLSYGCNAFIRDCTDGWYGVL